MHRLFYLGRAVKISMVWPHLSRDLKEVREPCGYLGERCFRKRKQNVQAFEVRVLGVFEEQPGAQLGGVERTGRKL